MAKIHHATLAKAKKLGLRMELDENEVVVYQGDARVASHMMGNKALETAITKLGLTDAPAPAKAPKAAKEPKAPKAPKAAKAPKAEGEDDPVDNSKSIVKKKFKTEYKARGGHSGDELAELLDAYCKTGQGKKRRVVVAAVREVAEANGVWQPQYADMNPGQQRMNVGNRLRGLLKKGKPVKVGKQTVQPDVVE